MIGLSTKTSQKHSHTFLRPVNIHKFPKLPRFNALELSVSVFSNLCRQELVGPRFGGDAQSGRPSNGLQCGNRTAGALELSSGRWK